MTLESDIENPSGSLFDGWKSGTPSDFIENMSGEILNYLNAIKNMTDFIKKHPALAEQMGTSLLDEMTLQDVLVNLGKKCDAIYAVLQASSQYVANQRRSS